MIGGINRTRLRRCFFRFPPPVDGLRPFSDRPNPFGFFLDHIVTLLKNGPPPRRFLFISVFIVMKKVIKLTESDLTRIVKRIIVETNSDKNEVVRTSMVNHLTRYGFESTAKLIGSVEVFKRIFGNTPEEFLQSFDNLEKVLYKDDNPNFYFLFADNGAGVVKVQIYPSGYVSASIHPAIIVEPLHYVYKVSYPDIPKLIIPWLENSYGVSVDDLQNSIVTNRGDL